jgi:hypothetical protein
MTTNNATDKKGVLAIGLNPELDAFVKRAVEKAGQSAAHIGRVATLEACALILGEKCPEIVESKKGPKAGAKSNPEAEKYGLTSAEYSRRFTALFKKGHSPKEIMKMDLSIDPAPVKHREPKVVTAPTA